MPTKISIAFRNGEVIDASQDIVRERLEAFAETNRTFWKMDVVVNLADPARPVVRIKAPLVDEGLVGKAVGRTIVEAVDGATQRLLDKLDERREPSTHESSDRDFDTVKTVGSLIAILLACILCVTILIKGCRFEETVYDINGTITVNGQPLDSGSIAFEDLTTGKTAGGDISNGSFAFPGIAGNYVVTIFPGRVIVRASPDEPPSIQYLEDAVPEKYRSTATSDLTAEVHSRSTTFQFDLSEKPLTQTNP